jgi:hypothetical protein
VERSLGRRIVRRPLGRRRPRIIGGRKEQGGSIEDGGYRQATAIVATPCDRQRQRYCPPPRMLASFLCGVVLKPMSLFKKERVVNMQANIELNSDDVLYTLHSKVNCTYNL